MLSTEEIPRLIDVSAVKAADSFSDVERAAELAVEYNFICVFAMPCYTARLVGMVSDYDSISVGGAVGFPSGAATSMIKKAETEQFVEMGCDEIDMVINIGALKDGDHKTVEDDIRTVVKAAGGLPVKTILEVSYLSEEQIVSACRIAVSAGAAYIKTGTGWASSPATPEVIRLIKGTVGDSALVKAAGGVRTLEDLEAMYDEGCRRFGIGAASALNILEAAHKREGRVFRRI